MEKVVTELSGSQMEVEFILTPEDLKPHFDKAYKEAIPHIEMKGFRKGKVPFNIVKKNYGKRIEVEAIEEISNQTFQDFLKNDKVNIIGTPALIDIQEKDGGYSFKISYEVIPEFEIAEYRGVTIEEPIHPVTDQEIEEEVHAICRNNGDLVPAEQVADELHLVDVNIQEIDEATNVPIIGQTAQDSKLFLADQYVLPEMKANLLNTKVDDNFIFRPNQYDPHAPNKIYRITVKGIEKLVPKELTDDFVNEYTKGKLLTVQDLKDEIGFKMQEKWNDKARVEMENQLILKLVDMNEFDLPDTVVKEVMLSMAEDVKKRYANHPQGKDLDINYMAEGLRPIAERTVKWEIIRNKIIKKEQIEVEDSDVDDIINAEVEHTKGDKGAISAKIKQNRQISENILTKKVIDLLIDFAVTEEIPFEEYEAKKELEHGHDHEGHDHGHEFYDEYEEIDEHEDNHDHEHDHHHVHDENCNHDHGHHHVHDENCDHDHEGHKH